MLFVSIHMDMCVRASADILHVCVGVLYKKDWRQEQCNLGGICSGMGFSPEVRTQGLEHFMHVSLNL